MEQKSKRNKRIIIISIILSFISISTLIINFELNNKIKDINTKYQSISKEKEEIQSNIQDLNAETKNIEKEIDNINNLDTNITNLKKEYFASIKQLEDEIIKGNSNKKIAYLTFDDGPYYLTYKFLDILDEYNVKATFFTIGSGKESCYDNSAYNCHLLFKEEAKRGHTIANHTYSHAIFRGLYNSPESFIQEVKKQEELIKNETGLITNIVRFPGGTKTAGNLKNSIAKLLKENNYGWIDWNALDGDGGNISGKEEAWKIFTNSINENIEVVLMHDYNAITLSILPDIIEYLQKNNYIMLPLFYESNMVNK